MWNALWPYCVIFSVLVTRSGVIVLYFPLVERALELFCYNFRAWNVLWRYCVIFFAHGTRSGISVLYFPRMERALVLLC